VCYLVVNIITAFYESDEYSRKVLIQQIGDACRKSGFFQLVNHGIPDALQKSLLTCSEELFSLPEEIKELYNKGNLFLISSRNCTVLIMT
jgi:isopenicillin N synthase-like dioxygenase